MNPPLTDKPNYGFAHPSINIPFKVMLREAAKARGVSIGTFCVNVLAEAASAAIAPPVAPEQPALRGRGRPRTRVFADAAEGERVRARDRGYYYTAKAKKAAKAQQAQAVVPEPTPTPKKRGRPRKYPTPDQARAEHLEQMRKRREAVAAAKEASRRKWLAIAAQNEQRASL